MGYTVIYVAKIVIIKLDTNTNPFAKMKVMIAKDLELFAMFLVASLMSLTASLVTTSRMQQCLNVMCISWIYKVFSLPVSLLYSVENKTYYYYYM